MVKGPCLSDSTRWYFDKSAGRCMTFEFGGCLGNNNNFVTEDECISACPQVKESIGGGGNEQ